MRITRCSLLPVMLLAGAFCCLAHGSPSQALTPQEIRGKQIYTLGTSSSGREITAVLGKEGTEISASVLSCANCHGRDGRGKPEGGLTPSDITWDSLTRPYSSSLPARRKHPPYSEQSLKRAI